MAGMKVYLVNDNNYETVAVFSTREKASSFIREGESSPMVSGRWIEEMTLDSPDL